MAIKNKDRGVPSPFLAGLGHHIQHLPSEVFRTLYTAPSQSVKTVPTFQDVWSHRPVAVVTSTQERQTLLLVFCFESLPQHREDNFTFLVSSRAPLPWGTISLSPPNKICRNQLQDQQGISSKGHLGSCLGGDFCRVFLPKHGHSKDKFSMVPMSHGRLPAAVTG